MLTAEKIKKYKELLDAGIITQDEFEKKKNELLAADMPEIKEKTVSEEAVRKKTVNKKLLKTIIIVASIVAVLLIAFFVSKKIIEDNQAAKRINALEQAIQPIMDSYGLAPYEVKTRYSDYEVYAEGFESLTNGEALACLEELDNISIDDPINDDSLSLGGVVGMVHVHPGLDVEYSYWRVSSLTVLDNEIFGGNYTKPGIYCDRDGSNKCIFEYEN